MLVSCAPCASGSCAFFFIVPSAFDEQILLQRRDMVNLGEEQTEQREREREREREEERENGKSTFEEIRMSFE
jgi:hypothetical protein